VTAEEAPPDDPGRCHACRGTGQVISNFGGTPHQVECPWCEGTGRFIPDHDAQGVQAASAGVSS
jgi:DnaJ-class molecular chaperone